MKIEYENKEGIDLYEWLKDNYDRIEKLRLLYIISTNAEPKIIKIGVSNVPSRIWSYVNEHGTTNKKNPCEGVNLYFIASVEKRDVDPKKTEIANLETKVKNYMKKTKRLIKQLHNNKHIRGDERYIIKPIAFINIVKSTMNKEREYKPPNTSFMINNKEFKLKEEYRIKWNNHNDIKYKGWIKAKITRIYQDGGVMFRVTDMKAKQISSEYRGHTYRLFHREKYFPPNELKSSNIKHL